MKQTLEEPILRRVLIEGMTDNYGGKESYIMSIYRIIDKNKYLFDFIAYDDHIAYENEILTTQDLETIASLDDYYQGEYANY